VNLGMQFIDFIHIRRNSGAPARIVCAAASMVMLLFGMVDTPDAQTAGTSRTPAAVDPKIYDAYVGQYELAPDFILTISKQNDRLFAQATGQEKVEIFPESPEKFYYTIVDAQITFVKNDKGVVTELVLHQRGDHHAMKIK